MAEVHASGKGTSKLCSTHQGRGASRERKIQASDDTISTSRGSHEQCNVYDGTQLVRFLMCSQVKTTIMISITKLAKLLEVAAQKPLRCARLSLSSACAYQAIQFQGFRSCQGAHILNGPNYGPSLLGAFLRASPSLLGGFLRASPSMRCLSIASCCIL